MSVAQVIDTAGVAIITGGASGLGLAVAERLVQKGMSVAILDISVEELAESQAKLRSLRGGQVLAIRCDVAKFDECVAAKKEVAVAFPGAPVSFLFNNAGTTGTETDDGQIVRGKPDVWNQVFSVNVFGVVHIIKTFLPAMISGGPLPSGKKSFIVTTSSVAGLLNHIRSPYSISKMAVTAICEQLTLELDAMGTKAAHVSAHSLHPTVAATNIFVGRNADGQLHKDTQFLQRLVQEGAYTANNIINGLFRGLDEGNFYIIVDHPLDIPTSQQIAMRMEDQMSAGRPREPEQVAVLLKSGTPKRTIVAS